MMKTTVIGLLAVAAVLAKPAPAAAQETSRPSTTIAIAMSKLRDEQEYGIGDAVAILTQQQGHRPQSEIDAFADSLVALAIAGELSAAPGGPDAEIALVVSAFPEEEGAIPYRGAYDALERIFAATESVFILSSMAKIDPRRARPLLLELARNDDYVGCAAQSVLVELADEDDPARTLMERRAFECLIGGGTRIVDERVLESAPLFFPPYNDILSILRAGDATGVEHAANTLAQVDRLADADELDALADSMVALAASGGEASPLVRQVLEALEQSARPADRSYVGAYDAVTRLFEATGAQAALESLARMDPGRAVVFLAEVAGRDDPASCKARPVLAGLAGGPRVLGELEAAGGLKYRCGGDM